MAEISGGASSSTSAWCQSPGLAMCQIVPLSPLSLVTRPTAMMPPLPSGIAWRTTGRPAGSGEGVRVGLLGPQAVGRCAPYGCADRAREEDHEAILGVHDRAQDVILG